MTRLSIIRFSRCRIVIGVTRRENLPANKKPRFAAGEESNPSGVAPESAAISLLEERLTFLILIFSMEAILIPIPFRRKSEVIPNLR